MARRFDSAEQEAYLNLWRTYDRLRALEDECFAEFGLTAQQYNLLRLLRAARPGAVPTLKLVERLISRAPDVTRMLDKLEAAGLVARARTASVRSPASTDSNRTPPRIATESSSSIGQKLRGKPAVQPPWLRSSAP